MVIRLLAAVLALVAATPAAGVAGDAPEHALTITGSRNSYATLIVTQEIRYRLPDARADFAGGRWAGFLIGQDRPTLWTARDPRRPLMPGSPWTKAPREVRVGVLQPGRYRVFLFADGQETTIRVPWSGRNVTIRPDAALDARVTVDQAPVHAAGSTAAWTIPLDGKARTETDVVSYFTSAVSRGYTHQTCITARPTDECGPARVSRHGGTLTGDAQGTGKQGATAGLAWRGEIAGEATGLLVLAAIRYPWPGPYNRSGVDYGY